MQKKEQTAKRESLFTLKNLVIMALMIALSIILTRYLAIDLMVIRISLGNLPIILTSITLGPIAGGAVGLVADLLGSLQVGYGFSISPVITLGAVLVGVLSGVVFKYVPISKLTPKLILTVSLAHLVGSVIVKTIGLAILYVYKFDSSFWLLMLTRLGTYSVTAIVEILLIAFLLKSKAIRSLLIGAKK